MVDAVSSSLVSAQVLQVSAERVSTPRPTVPQAAAVEVRDAPEVPKAPYISPHIVVDVNNNVAVIQIRDSDTGEVQNQFPSESRLAQLSRAQAEQARQVRLQRAPSLQQSATAASDVSDNAPVDVVTVQDVTSSASANSPIQSPQIAVAALSAGAQSGQPVSSANVDVVA